MICWPLSPWVFLLSIYRMPTGCGTPLAIPGPSGTKYGGHFSTCNKSFHGTQYILVDSNVFHWSFIEKTSVKQKSNPKWVQIFRWPSQIYHPTQNCQCQEERSLLIYVVNESPFKTGRIRSSFQIKCSDIPPCTKLPVPGGEVFTDLCCQWEPIWNRWQN